MYKRCSLRVIGVGSCEHGKNLRISQGEVFIKKLSEYQVLKEDYAP
jgi:hypothetical protein